MRPEYDFSGAMRGRHYRPLHKGYSVTVHKADGTKVVEHYRLAEGAILLQPDVQAYFGDSEAVNKALRSLIMLMSELPGNTAKSRGRKRTADRPRAR